MNSLLSLDLGSGNIHLVEGNYLKNTVFIEKAKSYPIPEGCFNGEAISNIGLLTETVSDAVKSFGAKTRDAIITINGAGATIRDIELPDAKPKVLNEMVRNELIQLYHILPTDVIQYKFLEKHSGDNGSMINNYRAVAIDSELIDDYHALLIGAKLKPVAMDINVNAIDKLFSGELSVNDRILNGNGTILFDFGKTTSTVYIITQGKPIFYRHLTIGCSEIERMIYDETFISEKEIRKLKEEGFNFFGTDDTAIKYFNVLRPLFYNLTDEIRKIIGFYSSRTNIGNGGIEQIYLCGGGSNLAGFAEYCESNLNISTEQIRSMTNIKAQDPNINIDGYLNAIGALIRY